jgi:hypothetical protein
MFKRIGKTQQIGIGKGKDKPQNHDYHSTFLVHITKLFKMISSSYLRILARYSGIWKRENINLFDFKRPSHH